MNELKPDTPGVIKFADHEVIVPPNRLKKAVKRSGDDDRDPLTDAEEALEHLSVQFQSWMDDECAQLDRARQLLRVQGLTDETRQILFRAAHDIKGHGATFGYPLAADVADSLCRLIENCADFARILRTSSTNVSMRCAPSFAKARTPTPRRPRRRSLRGCARSSRPSSASMAPHPRSRPSPRRTRRSRRPDDASHKSAIGPNGIRSRSRVFDFAHDLIGKVCNFSGSCSRSVNSRRTSAVRRRRGGRPNRPRPSRHTRAGRNRRARPRVPPRRQNGAIESEGARSRPRRRARSLSARAPPCAA